MWRLVLLPLALPARACCPALVAMTAVHGPVSRQSFPLVALMHKDPAHTFVLCTLLLLSVSVTRVL